MKRTCLITFLCSILLLVSCTDLERELGSSINKETSQGLIDARQLVDANYTVLRGFATQDLIFALQEHSGDAVMGPTRGGDWDDNGVWRVLHLHTWATDNNFILNTFNDLSGGVFRSIEALEIAEGQERGEALFLQAWFVYYLNDLFGQVPFRENLDSLGDVPITLKGEEAVNFIVGNLEEAITLLPETSDISRANKTTARAFLAKVLLNKAVYVDDDRIPPFSFENADLNQVVSLCDEVINSGQFSLETGVNYYDNFAPENGQIGSELIFTQANTRGEPGGNVASRYLMTLHYNNNPGGWNGFTTIADFYNKFEDGDVRKGGIDYPGHTEVGGLKAGFLIGQQFDADGNPLEDRLGNPLSFTLESPIISDGPNIEVSGVRGLKYLPDYQNVDTPENDFVLLRYADVLLTKAEALFRLGQDGEALQIINDIRTAREASTLSSLTADDIIDERGRELWWEGHRRTDLIRFGEFNDAWTEKSASEPFRVLFPIPERTVANNPNLTQNPGY
ncbi:RagB/SusD family nutrient uptake outer membrane protein [Flavobacteriaceae bacterium 14752]|uniref:RagB/SusD family nutrient uptake outer membrane protein n=1 Tax=Mesohalobacter salilacus TaxID=2491711 RepID=UPI000F630575|nr:RagB/SusD family nutrient uptake outer membrane protein [Flavobacteriaceae bacterium 14752]